MKSERIFAIIQISYFDIIWRIFEKMNDAEKIQSDFKEKNTLRRKMKTIVLSFMLILLTGCSVLESLDLENLGEEKNQEEVLIEAEGNLKVHYIDVGQGDSTFIQLPNDKNVLIDGGKRAKGHIVIDYLNKLKVEKIDYLIATHPHEDHIGGLIQVIKDFEIGEIYLPDKPHSTIVFEDLLLAIKEKGYSIKKAEAGKILFEEEDLSMNIIAPDGISGNNLNDYSVSNQLIYGETDFLFTGDAEKKSEENMVNGPYSLKTDVLKVGHHGGDTSSIDLFLKKVRPDYAVISVGEGNSYGHPHPKVMKRLKDSGAEIYRTDEEGTVIAISDGKNISFHKKSSSKIDQGKENKEELEVFRTDTGSKYHLGDCSSLKGTKTSIPLEEAKEEGLEPCGICHPPK